MWRFVVFSVGLLALIGCGGGPKKAPSAVITGSVTYKGKPVNGATLLLYRTSGSGEFTIPVTQEGTFRITDIPEGDYTVVIQPAKEMTQTTKGMDKEKIAELQSKLEAMKTIATIPIPDKYKQRAKTDLKLTVAKTDQVENFELKD